MAQTTEYTKGYKAGFESGQRKHSEVVAALEAKIDCVIAMLTSPSTAQQIARDYGLAPRPHQQPLNRVVFEPVIRRGNSG